MYEFVIAAFVCALLLSYYSLKRPEKIKLILGILTILAIVVFVFFTSFTVMMKPAIYLYPEKTTIVQVTVDVPFGFLSKAIPDYGSGWAVVAEPSGKIDGKFDYLFYESTGNVPKPKYGFVVTKQDLPVWFEKYLSKRGLNEKEISEFLEYWIPKLDKKPYYFVSELNENDIERVSQLHVEPKPDTIIRVFFYFQALDKQISVFPEPILGQERKGFTLVEWGGTLNE